MDGYNERLTDAELDRLSEARPIEPETADDLPAHPVVLFSQVGMSDASDIQLPEIVKSKEYSQRLRTAVWHLMDYGGAVVDAMQAVEPRRHTFLDHAYQLWRALQTDPTALPELLGAYRVNVRTGHQRNPFNLVLKVLHAAAHVQADVIQFASYHGRLLERIHEHFCREAGLEPGPKSLPPVSPGRVAAEIGEAGSVKRAVSAFTLSESEAERQARLAAEAMRIDAWLCTGPTIKVNLSGEDHFSEDAGAYVAVIARDSSGQLRVKLVQEAKHATLFRHAKTYEEDHKSD